MAAEVDNSKEAERQPSVDAKRGPEKRVPVAIAACDVGSLLEQFLEYEEKQDKATSSSVSLTPVTSPSGSQPTSFHMPEFKKRTEANSKQPQIDFGLTPPVSPPSNSPTNPDENSLNTQDLDSSQNNSLCGDVEMRPVTEQDVNPGMSKESDNQSSPAMEIEHEEKVNQVYSDRRSSSGSSCIVEKCNSIECQNPELNLISNQKNNQTSQQDSGRELPRPHDDALTKKDEDCAELNQRVEPTCNDDAQVEKRNKFRKWEQGICCTDNDESDSEDKRFNPREGERSSDSSTKRKRSPDPYASSDSEDERDRIRWRKEHERRTRQERKHRRERRSKTRDRSRSRNRSRSRSRERRTGSHRDHERRRRRRSESREHRRRLDRNSNDALYDIEQERKKTFRMDRSFREESREERKIVYIGKISDDTEKDDVWRRFRKYGPIEKVTVHYREEGDNYAFVTFVESASALEAVEDANSDPREPVLEICFGGRRKFCGGSYVDFDSNTSLLEEKQMNEGVASKSQSTDEMDFDALLKMALKKTKRR